MAVDEHPNESKPAATPEPKPTPAKHEAKPATPKATPEKETAKKEAPKSEKKEKKEDKKAKAEPAGEQKQQGTKRKGLYDASPVVDGKRERKQVERLEVVVPVKTVEPTVKEVRCEWAAWLRAGTGVWRDAAPAFAARSG